MKKFKKIFFYVMILFIIILAVIIFKRINTHNLRDILGIEQELYVTGNDERFNDILNYKYTISNKELRLPGAIGADHIATYYDKDGNFLFDINIYGNIAYINKANSDKRIDLYCDITKKVDNYSANIILPNTEHGLLEKVIYDLMNQFKNDNSINKWRYEQIFETSISKEISYTNKEKEELPTSNFNIDIKIKEFKNIEGMNQRFEYLSKYLKLGNGNKIIKVEDEVKYEELKNDSGYYDILIRKGNIIVEIKERKNSENDIQKFEAVKKVFEKYSFSY